MSFTKEGLGSSLSRQNWALRFCYHITAMLAGPGRLDGASLVRAADQQHSPALKQLT